MNRKIAWPLLILLLPIAYAGSDKEKKAYELIYQDVQILKKQFLQFQEKIEKNTEDINNIKEQVKELLNLAKLLQTEQASLKADQAKIPSQHQILLGKLETLNQQLVKVSEDLIEVKRFPTLLPQLLQQIQPQQPPQPEEQPEEKKETKVTDKKKAPGKKAREVKKEEPAPAPSKPAPQTPAQPAAAARLSPQEVYNMANSDYLKGNFDLAIAGFKMYVEQFPESPLVDDCLYWIGECFFSQKKFKEAVDQFNELILNYPGGDKIPEAYLKKGISLAELSQKEEAISVFKLLISKFPLEEETKIAQQKIKDLTTVK